MKPVKAGRVVRAMVAGAAVLSGARLVAQALDDYKYYPDGYNPEGTAPSVYRTSGIALATGAERTATMPGAREARYRTWYTSSGTRLRSDKFTGLFLIVR